MARDTGFQLIMISAGFEHGGNFTLRLFDGHPELYVYPFESQLGNSVFSDYLSSIVHYKYRYPEFPISATYEEDFELFYDEEMKLRLRSPASSKFRDVNLELKETDRKAHFVKLLNNKPRTRANIVAAFFQATFDSWTNLKRSGKEHIYVGYSPAIITDADRILADFPESHLVHIVRNPYSAYAETKHRPFPQSLNRYIMTWNLLHHIALVYKERYARNVHILRYEDLISQPEEQLAALCQQLGLPFSETLLYPSWNGRKLEQINPWGTIRKATPENDKATRDELSEYETHEIRLLTGVMRQILRYKDI
jgi:hypothetical protein